MTIVEGMLRFGGLCASRSLRAAASLAGWPLGCGPYRRLPWPALRNVLVGDVSCIRHFALASRKQTRTLSFGGALRARASTVRNRIWSVKEEAAQVEPFDRRSRGHGARGVQSKRSANARAGTRGASMDTAHRACGCAPNVDDGCRRGATRPSSAGIVPGACSGLLVGCAVAVSLPQPRHRASGGHGRRRGWAHSVRAYRRLAVGFRSEHAAPLAERCSQIRPSNEWRREAVA
jgi:hypothetical protein